MKPRTAAARPRANAPTGVSRPKAASTGARPRPASAGGRPVKKKKLTGYQKFVRKVKKNFRSLMAPAPAQTPRSGSYTPRRRGPDWPMILALAVIVVILVGIIALIVIGARSCSDGCGRDPSADPGKAIIYQATQPPVEPSETAGANQTAQNPVNAAQTQAATPAQNTPVQTGNNGGLRSARIRNVGDFVIHEAIYKQAKKLAQSTGTEYAYNFAPMLNLIRDVMQNADLTVANVDGPMGGEKYYKYGYSGYPQFNTPPYLMYALKDAGVDMLTLANNHMLDTWYDGLMAEIENVETAGLWHVGANRSTEEKNTPVIYEVNGIKIGFMNYTVSLNDMERQKSLNPNALAFGVNATRNSDVTVDAKALRNAGAEVIVCYMHWGTEYEDVDSNQQTLAKTLVQAGVDVIVGGHPHIVQPAKWLTGTNQFGETQRTLCLYSMGNFLSDQRQKPRDGGIIFDFTIQEQTDGSFEIVSPSYLPTWVWRTGDDASGYSYQVVPIGQYLQKKPDGMSDADYKRMIESYQESVSVMGTGVGSCVSQ